MPWVFTAPHGLAPVVASGGFSSHGAQALGTPPSVVVACGLNSRGLRALERGPQSSYDAWALVAPQLVESSWTWDQTGVPCIDRWLLIHGTTREVLVLFLSLSII